MAKIISASAWANNEVAYIAWITDGKIPDCLGFEVTRVYLDSNGNGIYDAGDASANVGLSSDLPIAGRWS